MALLLGQSYGNMDGSLCLLNCELQHEMIHLGLKHGNSFKRLEGKRLKTKLTKPFFEDKMLINTQNQ